MKQLLIILLIPSLLMACLGVYWLGMVRALDGKRAEFLDRPETRNFQRSIDGLISGQVQASVETYKHTLKEQQSLIEWERDYYEMLRGNMVYLGGIAWFIALCQVAAVWHIHKRLRKTRA